MARPPAAVDTPRARARVARRRKFIACAERLFLRHGYAGTSVNEVVRLAGGSLATLYAEFGTKEGLFEAVIAGRVARGFSRVSAAPATGDIATRLRQLATRIHEQSVSAPTLAMYRLAVAEGPRFPGLRTAVLSAGLDAFLEHLATLFRDLGARGALRIDDDALAARRFLALVQGQHQFAAACGGARRIPPAVRRLHVDQAVDAFLALYGRRGRPSRPTA